MFDIKDIDKMATHTYEALEYLRINEDIKRRLNEAENAGDFVYHAPCHARNQGLAGQSVELFDVIDGTTVQDIGSACSGISGTYGWK